MWEITGATQFTLSVTQAAGGTDFIQKVLEGFGVPSVKSVFMVDMNAYDGFAAMSTIEDLCEKGYSTSCCQLIFQTDFPNKLLFTNSATHSYSTWPPQ